MTYDYFGSCICRAMAAQVVEGANETMRIRLFNRFRMIETKSLVYELNQRVIEDYLI